MKKIPLLPILVIAGVFGIAIAAYTLPRKYETKLYEPGELVINDRNYFEDGEDFQQHVCPTFELQANCGALTQKSGQVIFTIKEKAMDDSIATYENIYILEPDSNFRQKLYVSKLMTRWTCHKGRGSTTWTTNPCF